MGRISFTLMDLQQISYRLQGKGKLKFRYVFINNNKGRRPQRIKHIRGGSSSTGEANITSNVSTLSLDCDTIAIEILSRLPVKSLMRFKCL